MMMCFSYRWVVVIGFLVGSWVLVMVGMLVGGVDIVGVLFVMCCCIVGVGVGFCLVVRLIVEIVEL